MAEVRGTLVWSGGSLVWGGGSLVWAQFQEPPDTLGDVVMAKAERGRTLSAKAERARVLMVQQGKRRP